MDESDDGDLGGEVTHPPAPPIQAEDAHGMLLRFTREESFSGPLPHPEVLERYAQLYPDAPRVIIRAFEAQTKHRLEMEATYVHEQTRRLGRGQILGTALIALGIIGGITAILVGQSVAGASIIVACVAAGVLSFVFGYPREKS